ncbi:3D (Asp-Asp-Asp) domain-containing protein [Seinonella peptonophila]|uniref:3D (Asp-Asp-Asp) domain-containing protein n=1 Tax=Seinonella peptonophila TaxID=112248 RepID=A0A1M4V2T9_9BACL|nr:3D domain-containing protein [Seinonella peptonophila]SHE63249.1 3D (Asp-Asp-Asp) domain-containing protein [Seinonella peptonophila]
MKNYLLRGLLLVLPLLIVVGCSSGTAKEQKQDGKLTIVQSDQEKPLIISQPKGTLAQILQKNGQNVTVLKKKYKPSIPWDQEVKAETPVKLQCNCQVNFVLSGKKVGTYQTTKQTVGGFLQEKKVKLTAWHELLTPVNQRITDGMTVTVDQYEQKVKKEISELPFEKKEEKDDNLEKGKKKVKTKGKKGKKVFEVVLNLKNGQLVSTGEKRLVKQIEPEPEVVLLGTKEKENGPPEGGQTMTVEATAYTHTGNPTATGVMPKRGTIAVDTKVIPLGTRLYIPGYGYGVAQDTGGAIKGHIIDLFMDSEEECQSWGRRTVKIKILD